MFQKNTLIKLFDNYTLKSLQIICPKALIRMFFLFLFLLHKMMIMIIAIIFILILLIQGLITRIVGERGDGISGGQKQVIISNQIKSNHG